MRFSLRAVVAAVLVLPSVAAVGALPAQAGVTTGAALLNALPVAAETTAATYDRALFEHWIDADGDGCDTREEVLLEESTATPVTGAGCTVTGQWTSWYDGAAWTDPAAVDIDHMVALQEAWQSGASNWTPTQRRNYANDLAFAGSLVAVTDTVNQSKGAGDPAEWLPPATGAHCGYAVQWVAVKYRWRLSVDASEKAALATLLAGSCGSTTVSVDAVALTSDRLQAGQSLAAGQALVSSSGSHRLVMQTDGNLVLYASAGAALWSSRTGGNPGARLVLQGDGNLVIYSTAGKALWFNGARGTSTRLVIQGDGNLVEYSGTGAAIWNIRTATAPPAPAPVGTLAAGARLLAGKSLPSTNGAYRLTVQPDGNMVVYKASGGAVWSSGTRGSGAYLVMQPDGNAVLYAGGRAVWNSRTSGNPGARLAMQGDGNLVVYSAGNRALWASGPPRPAPAPAPTPTPIKPANPGNSKNCGDFSTWRAAQDWFNTYFPHYGDVAALDADGDRIACETLPGAP